MRVPTEQEIKEFKGGATAKNWRELPQEWRCPACGRTKEELIYRNSRSLNFHVQRLNPHGAPKRVPPTRVCIACWNAEKKVRTRLRASPDFIFYPHEIGRFIIPQPHASKHKILFDVAEQVYKEALSAIKQAGAERKISTSGAGAPDGHQTPHGTSRHGKDSRQQVKDRLLDSLRGRYRRAKQRDRARRAIDVAISKISSEKDWAGRTDADAIQELVNRPLFTLAEVLNFLLQR
jgi:hypothetical protein